MSDTTYVLLAILCAGALTFGLRATPFVAGRWLERHALVHKLGVVLPLPIMVLLLVDTATGQAQSHAGLPWPEVLAVLVVVLLQWWTRQTLLSILVGTALYVGLRAL